MALPLPSIYLLLLPPHSLRLAWVLFWEVDSLGYDFAVALGLFKMLHSSMSGTKILSSTLQFFLAEAP